MQGTRAEDHKRNMAKPARAGFHEARGPSSGFGALPEVMKFQTFPIIHTINFKVSSVTKENKSADIETFAQFPLTGLSRTLNPPELQL